MIFSLSFFFSPLPSLSFVFEHRRMTGKVNCRLLPCHCHTDTAHLPLVWQPGWCGPFRLFSRCRLLGRSPSDDGVICCLKIVPLWHIWCSRLGSLFSWISLCLLINLPWLARHGNRGEPQAPTWVWFLWLYWWRDKRTQPSVSVAAKVMWRGDGRSEETKRPT